MKKVVMELSNFCQISVKFALAIHVWMEDALWGQPDWIEVRRLAATEKSHRATAAMAAVAQRV